MIKHLQKSIWVVLLAGMAGCQSGGQKGADVTPFFDLEAFFQGEIGRMEGVHEVEKKITFNGKTEEQQVKNWDATVEMEGFKELHINRPTWKDQYQIDSLKGEGGILEGIRYAARDSSLRIRQVEIDWKAGAVEEVRVEKYMKNLIVFFHQTLKYRPEEGYSLWRAQKVPLMKRSELGVEVRYH